MGQLRWVLFGVVYSLVLFVRQVLGTQQLVGLGQLVLGG